MRSLAGDHTNGDFDWPTAPARDDISSYILDTDISKLIPYRSVAVPGAGPNGRVGVLRGGHPVEPAPSHPAAPPVVRTDKIANS